MVHSNKDHAELSLAQVNGAHSFTINRKCDRSQLLVTLRKNEGSWLSPVGWVASEKGTLLDCKARGEVTEVEIPSEYAGAMKTGDVIHLNCFELDLDGSMRWKAPAPAKATGLMGLLGGQKTEPVEAKTDTERRANDARKQAESIRTQMERAQAAKEEAHRRALDAQRLAEEARLAEVKQIAEMEKAALALAEAEENQKAQMLRLEEERRAEEQRRIEEARLAEQARQVELKRRREAALKEERAKLVLALQSAEKDRDITEQELSDFTVKLHTSERVAKDKFADLEGLQTRHAAASKKLASGKNKNEQKQAELKAHQEKIDSVANEYALVEKKRSDLNEQVTKAEKAHDTAQRLASEALAKANDMKARFNQVKQAQSEAAQRVNAMSSDVSELRSGLKSRKEEAEQAHKSYERLSAKAAGLDVDLANLVSEHEALNAASQSTARELSSVQGRLENLIERELTTKAAIALIDRGGELKDVKAMIDNVSATPQARREASGGAAAVLPEAKKIGFKRPSINMLRRKPVSEPSVKAAPLASHMAGPKISKAVDETANQDGVQKLSLPKVNVAALNLPKVSAPKVSMPKVSVPKINVPKVSMPKVTVPEFSADNKRRAAILLASAATIAVVAVVGMTAIKSNDDVDQSLQARTAVTPNTAVLSSTALTKPTQLEETPLSDTPIELPELETLSDDIAAQKAAAQRAASQKQAAEPSEAVKTEAEIEEPDAKTPKVEQEAEAKPAPKAAAERELNRRKAQEAEADRKRNAAYAELTRDIQTQLTTLGFYFEKIDGKTGPDTNDAIKQFKELYGLPVDESISGEFINEVKRAVLQAETSRAALAASAAQAALRPEPAPQPIPEPVWVDRVAPAQPAPTPISVPSVIEPEAVAAEPVQTASLAPVANIITRPEPDVIVEAKRTVAMAGEYPPLALRRGFDDDVDVFVEYDVDATGAVTNVSVVKVDGATRFKSKFQEAGVEAAKSQRFSPKTVNGQAVVSTGHSNKIAFVLQ